MKSSINITDGSGSANQPSGHHRKGHRRQESMYTMTGLYSETITDDSSIDVPQDSENSECSSNGGNVNDMVSAVPNHTVDTVIKCHSRHPSSGLIDQDKVQDRDEMEITGDCGILGCRPASIQKMARIKIFVLLLSILVTLQQALSSGYINSVITTIEKRFEIPSSYSGLIASSYEIGNMITVIFVSYLGSRRHIPVWIGIGAVIMGIGSLVFMLPHFTGSPNPGISLANSTSDNICRGVSLTQLDIGLGRLSNGLSNPPLAPHNNLRVDNCIQGKSSTFGPVLLFVIAQMLLGCGGSPLFTLGTTYVDDHLKTESSSMYIGCMYSMAAFGPVLGFLLGAYLLSFHMDALSGTNISIDPGDRRWVGMWWGGFLLCGLLLLIVAIPFFSFPKVLAREKKKLRRQAKLSHQQQQQQQPPTQQSQQQSQQQHPQLTQKTSITTKIDSGYGKDIKDIPLSMWRLVSNPVYIVTCLGACSELMIVSGFIVFLPKYLETQFSLGKSQASVFTGSIAVPGACIGIFLGGCFLKRFELKPKGAVQFVLVSNVICLACYTLLFFLGCENLKMAGTTTPYYNSTSHTQPEPFQVNLTAACNFGCECHMTDVEPVCGNNGLTYFSPCHAGCTAFSSTSNYTNCACVQSNQPSNVYKGVGGSQAQASIANQDYAEVTVVPVASAGPCISPCRTIYPFLILLFFMTFIVAATQMPLLMIVLRSVSEEERSFALGMQFVIFRLFGYIPAPILFGNLIDSTCLLWQSTCGEKGGRCLIYNIETFRYKYVGLCATIKLVALAIFAVDWWLVKRRKHLEYIPSLDGNHVVGGSIISLDKLFADKDIVDGGDGECGTLTGSHHFDVNNKKVLIATRHLRNDSKTIQLELRYDNCGDKDEQKKTRRHKRSSSCDVKIGREYGDVNDYRLRRQAPNNYSNSRNDIDWDFRQKLTHSRTHSSDHANIKYILNFLKPDHSKLLSAYVTTSDTGSQSRKKHSRNHSYDQIYNMPNNIKLDQELHNKFNKNRMNANVATAVAGCSGVGSSGIDNDVNILKSHRDYSDNKFNSSSKTDGIPTVGGPMLVKLSHSRNNSKDLNMKGGTLATIVDDAGSADSILRHRRTNSKDLSRLAAMPSTSAAAVAATLSSTLCCDSGGNDSSNSCNNNLNNNMNNINNSNSNNANIGSNSGGSSSNHGRHFHHVRNLSQPKNQVQHDIQQMRHDNWNPTDELENDNNHRL